MKLVKRKKLFSIMSTKIRHNLFITILINLCIIIFAQSVSAQTLNSSDYKQRNDFINIFLNCNYCQNERLNISRQKLSKQDILLELKENSSKYSYYSEI